MRLMALVVLGGLGLLAAAPGHATGCEPSAVRGVLKPHVEPRSGLFVNTWAVPDGGKGGAPAWKLEAGGKVYYLDLGGDKKLAELAAKQSGKEVEVVGVKFKWRVIPRNVVDEKGRSFTILPPPPFDAAGLRVFSLRPARWGVSVSRGRLRFAPCSPARRGAPLLQPGLTTR